jgi:ectoine hydroxylase-related dioxygenase (phytanoyl-CoA dioxygenase family)
MILTSNGYNLASSRERLGRLEVVPSAEMNDREALIARLQRDGYLFLKKVINPQRVWEFRRYYFSKFVNTGLVAEGSDPREGIAGTGEVDTQLVNAILFNQIVPGEEYNAFCTCPEIVNFYEWFLGGELHLHRRKLIRHLKVSQTGATGAHYDLVYLRGGTDRLYTSWIPLGDCPVESGGLIYLENSHHYFAELDRKATKKNVAEWLTKDLPSLAEKLNSRWLLADYAAGDMVVHTPYTVHASLDNQNSQGIMRLSTDIRYQLKRDPIDGRWQNHWHINDGL